MSFFLCGCVSQPEEENLVQEKNTYRGKRNCLHQRHGKGKYLYENGDIYEGDWKNNKMHGYGQYRTPSGIMYVLKYNIFLLHFNGNKYNFLLDIMEINILCNKF